MPLCAHAPAAIYACNGPVLAASTAGSLCARHAVLTAFDAPRPPSCAAIYAYNGLALLAVWTVGRLGLFWFFFRHVHDHKHEVEHVRLPPCSHAQGPLGSTVWGWRSLRTHAAGS